MEPTTQESCKKPLRRSSTRRDATDDGGLANLPASRLHPGTRHTSLRRLRVRHQRPTESTPRKKESTTQEAREGNLRRGSTPRVTRCSRAAKGHSTTSPHSRTYRWSGQRL